ncbi:MAG TPA: helix-turn-helix domain-containing protein [Candidatus Kapabacteria bacterium]|nr:helix-turn-helix domain-containing protein [Candidatus Kapabacteria bacterium]
MIDLSHDWTGEDVKHLCEKHGILQRELAGILGVRLATVSDWVRGAARPSRLASVALTYLSKDLGGEVGARKKRT